MSATAPPIRSPFDPSPEDVAIVAMLKAIWKEHKGDPGVACAIRDALSDGQVSAVEARAIEASAAFALEPHYLRSSGAEDNPKFPPLPGPPPSSRLKED